MKITSATDISENVNYGNIPTKKPSLYKIPQKRPYVIPAKRIEVALRTNFIIIPIFAEEHLAMVPSELLKTEFRHLSKENKEN